MKNKILTLLKRFGKAFWGSLSHNLGLKLLSLLLAILLWSYVVSSNPSITRTKDINGLTAYVSNESTLHANRLALASDPAEALDGVSVQLEVPQSSYALADADNVQVTLDLSSVRAAGTQEVPLRATTTYGRVTRILPEPVKLELQLADLLRDRVGQVDMVEGVGLAAAHPRDARRNAHRRGGGRDRFEQHGVGRDLRAVADLERPQNLGAAADRHIFAERRMAFALVLARAAQGDPLVDRAAVADLGGLADNDPHAVVDQDSLADLRAGVYLDAGQKPGKLAEKARRQIGLVLIEPVRGAVHHDGVQTARKQQHLKAVARRRIAFPDGPDILFNRVKHPYHTSQKGCYESVDAK